MVYFDGRHYHISLFVNHFLDQAIPLSSNLSIRKEFFVRKNTISKYYEHRLVIKCLDTYSKWKAGASEPCIYTIDFSGSNTDGSSTMAVSNSSLSPLKKSNSCRFKII